MERSMMEVPVERSKGILYPPSSAPQLPLRLPLGPLPSSLGSTSVPPSQVLPLPTPMPRAGTGAKSWTAPGTHPGSRLRRGCRPLPLPTPGRCLFPPQASASSHPPCHLLGLDGGGGDDHAQVWAPALDLLQQPQQHIGGQAALVRFIHHDHAAVASAARPCLQRIAEVLCAIKVLACVPRQLGVGKGAEIVIFGCPVLAWNKVPVAAGLCGQHWLAQLVSNTSHG